ncbi:MAG: FAD-dependent oxidoreductase [Candidatus Omnitrophica bacterium]|nr:FAD-dependent oxidoreductase [Candidatus Omnitrophota bacterium]
MELKIEIPDAEYWKRQIKCQYACPVHTDARGYVRAIAEGDFEKAYLIARASNPLASICGRICGAPCESACRRGSIDESISIRGLKRSAAEESGAEFLKTLEVIEKIKDSLKTRSCVDRDDLGGLMEDFEKGKVEKVQGKSVGIIGSGPSGLAAAHDLALMGFSVVIYEMEPVPAGMLYLGVPAYRLPRGIIEAEVGVIKSLGVEIKTSCTIGKNITFEELRKRHDAVIIAVGCKRSRILSLPGADAQGVLGGVEFLRDVALEVPHKIGKKIVVIGGGNVAYDVSRTALRRQQMDVAVTAFREREEIQVTLCCIENRDEMLADEIEILEGEEEGIIRQNGYGPKEILTENNKAKGVVFQKVTSIFDEQNRFNPQYDPGDTITLEADTVMFAVGQRADITFINPQRDGIGTNERGVIVCDPETNETTAEGVFLAGDIAYGPRLMIDAIASGKKAARSIYQKLTGRHLHYETAGLHFPIENYSREMGYERIRRQVFETVDVKDRIYDHKTIIEKGYTCGQAKVEGSRCLDCGVNTIFDGSKCILCGGCVDVCPELCLKLVPAFELEGDKSFFDLVDLMKERKQTSELTAIIKDEEKCIRCALCAIRCPVDAITMERFNFREILK